MRRSYDGAGVAAAVATVLHVLNLLISLYAGAANAEQPVYVASEGYDEGRFGKYPVQEFKSVELIAPRPNIVRQDSRCSRDLMTFLSPRGYVEQATHPQATILDHNGHLIWTSGWDKKQIYNLMTQEYKGHNYITFWAGNDAVGGHGAGSYYMLDETYNMTRRLHAANGLKGDLHEFRFTPQGTALITVYDVQEVDLSTLGKKSGPIWDCLIQEIDIETGDLVFEWRASQHLNIADTYRRIGGEGEPGGAPFDWFHINSIDKDIQGNYLISSRYFNSIFYIDGKTGSVIWTMGGKGNKFKDLSGGKATNFAFQYDARWDNNYREITLFDNSREGGPLANAHPRGIRLRVDQVLMTVELITEYKNPTRVPAASQGSLQNLPNGNVLISYGYSGLFTEFTREGKILCETHYGPQSRYGTGDVQSYRVFKFNWRASPETDPDLAISQDGAMVWRAYASWNGATDVSAWVLQGTDSPNAGKWKVIEKKSRSGFETDFLLEADHPAYIRVVAVDSKGNTLGSSQPANATKVTITYKLDRPKASIEYENTWTWFTGVVTGFGLVVFALALRPAIKACFTCRRRTAQYSSLPTDEDKIATSKGIHLTQF
ncbi:arylsulfotransferase protein [Pochonia chlamydosporia 170]|uniref:Arylsulfotransferase protein n=1 Tax=Pochonia chlamydosporia 170 TaxID=1380566 RepID=A0A179EWK6_METCM|nr:arylsulfotransferase protein [Pochonia chlamydosporia 170]OAQ57556.1 arylsulfotransferase protein [Pochonia chlamydosporia 170]